MNVKKSESPLTVAAMGYWLLRMLPVVLLYKLSRGSGAAVVAPAGGLDKIKKSVLQAAGVHGLFEQFHPGLQGYDKRIESPDVAGKAIFRSALLRSEGPEDPVPDDQYTTMVPVEVGKVDPMMHAVMGGGIEDEFQRGGQTLNGLCMYPELIDEADGLHHEHDDGMKACDGHPAPEKKGSCQIACPGLPQGGCKIIATG